MKKIISALLAAILVIPSLVSVSAVEKSADLTEDKVIKIVSALEIMRGDENGNLNLENAVTRAEFVKMAIKASAYKDDADVKSAYSIFPDVETSHWAAGFIRTAVSTGLVNGYLDGTFRPAGGVKLEEAVTVTLKLLGYGDSDFNGIYPEGQLSKYRSLGLNTNISANKGETLTRRECMNLLYNALCTYTKSGKSYCETLGYTADKYGNIDFSALVEKKKSDAYVVYNLSSWKSDLSVKDGFTYYKNGKVVDESAISPYDILYCAPDFKAVWIYSNRITGVLEEISPSLIGPTSVTVAGSSYNLESTRAVNTFSGDGEFVYGDTVTLLLGESGVIAAEKPMSVSAEFFGISTYVDKKEYTHNDKTEYGYFVSVSTFDGKTLSVKTDISSFRTGIAVKVYYSDGEMVVRALSSTYNSVNNLITAIKSDKIAPDAILVDYYGHNFVKTYPARLKEISISAKNVAYYNINPEGYLDYLILNDATGDCHSYGVVYRHNGKTVFLTNNQSLSLENGDFGLHNVGEGVAQVKFIKNTADSIVRLAEMTVDSINNGKANQGGKSYRIWDKVQCFTLEQKTYSTPSSSDKAMSEIIDQVTFDTISEILLGDEYTVKGYYDSNGTIRVLVAQRNFK